MAVLLGRRRDSPDILSAACGRLSLISSLGSSAVSHGDGIAQPPAEQLAGSIDTGSINKQRRYFLIGATAVVGAAGVVGAAVPFVASWAPSAKARALGAPATIDISKLQTGEMLGPTPAWRGQPIFVLHAPRSRSSRSKRRTTIWRIPSPRILINSRRMRRTRGDPCDPRSGSTSDSARTSAARRNTTAKSSLNRSIRTGRVDSSVLVTGPALIWPVAS